MKINTTRYSNTQLLSLILIGITGGAAINLLPFIVSAFASAPELDAHQATNIASIELLGLCITGLSYRLWQSLSSPRGLITFGLVLYLIGSLGIVLWPETPETMMVWRFTAGAGAGLASAIAFAAIAQEKNPDSVFAVLVFFQVLWSALGSLLMPILIASVSWNMAFAYMAFLAVLTLICAWLWLPDLPETAQPAEPTKASQQHLNKSLIMFATIIWYVGLGLFWSESAQTGDDIGVSPALMGTIFAFGYLVSLGGNGIALWLSQRYSRHIPMLVSGLAHAGTYTLFTLATKLESTTFYLLAVLLFSVSWAIFTPFQIGLFSQVSNDGRFVTNYLPGSIVGTLIGTVMVPYFNIDQRLTIALVLMVICLSIYQFYHRRKTNAALTLNDEASNAA